MDVDDKAHTAYMHMYTYVCSHRHNAVGTLT